MLEKLLAIVRAGGTLEARRLATDLDVPLQLVEAMLEDLARRGLIQGLECRPQDCGGCGLRSGCVAANGTAARVWRGVV